MSVEIVECPHCNMGIVVDALNCGVFRCGVWRDTGLQINPHMSEDECKAALGNAAEPLCDRISLIWGCSKPFRIYTDASGVNRCVTCGYI